MSKRIYFSFNMNGLLLAALLVCVQLSTIWLGGELAFNRSRMLDGEFWRFFTGHFVHLGWFHLALNAIAAYLIYDIFEHPLRKWRLPVFLLVSSGLVSIGLLLFYSTTRTYVGLSGVLHGLLILGAINSRSFPSWIRFTVFAVVTGKVLWEQSPYYNESNMVRLIGGPVAEQAHLLGYCSGLLIILASKIWTKLR